MCFDDAAACFSPLSPYVSVQKAHMVCFKRCISSPDSKLSDKQKACLHSCHGALTETFKITAETFNAMAGAEHH